MDERDDEMPELPDEERRRGRKKAGKNAKPTSEAPNDEMLQRGRELGEWMKKLIHTMGMNPRQFSITIGYSTSFVYNVVNRAGLDTAGKYRRPSDAFFDAIESTTGYNCDEGRKIAGYNVSKSAPVIPAEIADLSPAARQALARFVEVLKADARKNSGK